MTANNSQRKQFESRHSRHRHVKEDALFAMSESLIDALADEFPSDFTDQDEAFERDLFRSSGCGFLFDAPINEGTLPVNDGYPIAPSPKRLKELQEYFGPSEITDSEVLLRFLDHPDLRSSKIKSKYRFCPPLRGSWQPDTSSGKFDRESAEMLDALRECTGRPKVHIERDRKQEAKELEVIRRKQESYLMWLLLNGSYQQEVAKLKTDWEDRVDQKRRFPVHFSARDQQNVQDQENLGSDCLEAFSAFYSQWGLERLLSWDLPLPLEPSLGEWDGVRQYWRDERPPFTTRSVNQTDAPWPYTNQEGLTLFLPWYLLKGKTIEIEELVDRFKSARSNLDLEVWLKLKSSESGNSGDIDLQTKSWIYRVYFLILFRRYPSLKRRKLMRLDGITAKLLKLTEERVKKLRQSLQRELHFP